MAETLEAIAYALMKDIMLFERKSLTAGEGEAEKVDRKWYLDAYAECLKAAGGHPHRTTP